MNRRPVFGGGDLLSSLRALQRCSISSAHVELFTANRDLSLRGNIDSLTKNFVDPFATLGKRVARDGTDYHIFRIVNLSPKLTAQDQPSTQEKLKIKQVWRIRVADQTVTPSSLPGTGCTTNTVNENLRLGREVVVDHVGQNRDINTTSSHVSDNEDVGNSLPEVLDLYANMISFLVP
jgi:hypothetical protein